jgi:lipoprotein-anchoring transpeptidase ErfK/SrfK
VVGVVLFLLLAAGGSAVAVYRYEAASSGRILPGVSVAGIDVGDMTRERAVWTVQRTADLTLERELQIRAGSEQWTFTAAELGLSADVSAAVDRAFAVAGSMSWTSRVWHRLLDKPVGSSIDLEFAYDRSRTEVLVGEIAEAVARPAVDASFEVVGHEVVTTKSRPGRVLPVRFAVNRLARAVELGRGSVTLPVRAVEPAVTEADLGQTILVRLSENRLYLYDGLNLDRTYPVATGSPGFPTPVGHFEIVGKRENPSWTNPDPDGWGAGLPVYIPPGPGNPLGTRALYLSAPGIRIHGTWDIDSIGTYASHGCIRMTIDQSEELYELVDVGTPVVIV